MGVDVLVAHVGAGGGKRGRLDGGNAVCVGTRMWTGLKGVPEGTSTAGTREDNKDRTPVTTHSQLREDNQRL